MNNIMILLKYMTISDPLGFTIVKRMYRDMECSWFMESQGGQISYKYIVQGEKLKE